ncbi:MAG: MATE family efflux transporter [Lachnospiraceae bacterium]|nr:MATE family efflux transporter [Lachnospiraceae bacterium]
MVNKEIERERAENNMGTAKVSGLVLKTGIPLMISLLINSLYNFVDSVFVSRISEDALTALSLAAPVQILMSAMGLGIAVGLNAVISKALGEQDTEKVQKTASAALVLAFLAWVLVVILEILTLRVYFRWQSGGSETIINYGIPYLRICMLGSLGMMGQWVFDRFVMASGKSSLFLYTLSAASVTNLILDPILIFGYFGLPAMGTAGAALATVIGQWTGCFAGYFINCRWNREIPIHFTAKADKSCIAAILKVGIPSTLVQAISSVLAIYVNSVLMVITPTAVAVYGACVKIQGLVTVGVNGMGCGLIPLVAYNYGAKKPKRVYQSCRWAMLYSVAFYSIFFLVMEIVPEQVLLLFDASEEMLAIGVVAVRIMAVSYLLSNVCLTYSAAFQGLGMGVQSMMLTLSRQVVLPIVFIAILSEFRNVSLIWMAFVLAEAVVIPLGMILWKKESGKALYQKNKKINQYIPLG